MYKAKVLRSGNWQRYETCRQHISVGQPYHEGEKLKATFEWAAKRFTKHVIVVADTLQRHNMDGNAQQAKRYGDEWLQRNRDLLGILGSPEIIRWDDLIGSPDFTTYLEKHGPAGASAYIAEEVAAYFLIQDRERAADIYPGSYLPLWDHVGRPDMSMTRIGFERIRSQPQGEAKLAA